MNFSKLTKQLLFLIFIFYNSQTIPFCCGDDSVKTKDTSMVCANKEQLILLSQQIKLIYRKQQLSEINQVSNDPDEKNEISTLQNILNKELSSLEAKHLCASGELDCAECILLLADIDEAIRKYNLSAEITASSNAEEIAEIKKRYKKTNDMGKFSKAILAVASLALDPKTTFDNQHKMADLMMQITTATTIDPEDETNSYCAAKARAKED